MFYEDEIHLARRARRVRRARFPAPAAPSIFAVIGTPPGAIFAVRGTARDSQSFSGNMG
jgi:hypothetical protein